MPRFKLIPCYRRPSLGELLGISQAERQVSRKHHLRIVYDPLSPLKNAERRAKLRVDYYSPPMLFVRLGDEKPSDFYAARNRHVYAAMHALFERGSKIHRRGGLVGRSTLQCWFAGPRAAEYTGRTAPGPGSLADVAGILARSRRPPHGG